MAKSDKNIIAHKLLDIFGHTRFAIAKSSNDGVSYSPMQGDIEADHLIAHLEGSAVYGSYALTETNSVWWLGWDVDSNDMQVAREYAQRITAHLETLEIPYTIEFSGGKGYHILLFLSEPMPASKAKEITEYIREIEAIPRTGKSHVECYPKQSKLTHANPLGNLLKIPLGRHPRTNEWSRFVDPYNGWESGDPINPIEALDRKITPEDAERLIGEEDSDAMTALINVLTPHWVAGERHALALNLSGYLANLGWGLEQVKDLVEGICLAAEDTEMPNRLGAVEDTFTSMQEGKNVSGYMYLADSLPGAVMRILIDAARQIATPPVMKKIEQIRLGKDAIFIKVKDVAEVIWLHLNETGMLLRTNRGAGIFWYEEATHLLWDFGTEKWMAHLHKHYGLNPAESFGKQAIRGIELRAIADSKITDVYHRSVFDIGTQKLYVNLGGPQVYILDGDHIEEGFNGECGYIFVTNQDMRHVPTPNLEQPVNVWKYLTDDISFATSDEVNASPEEQKELLRAWFLCFFFPQLMETKPILTLLGSPGSGKTSTMRRIVKILEGVKEDVITLSEDKPDSVRASIERHKLLVLDNLEHSKANWLVNLLNTLSTGSLIELRELFKTNEVYRIEPEVYVALTAVNIPFSESTLHSRILPVEMHPVQSIIPESVLQRKILQNQEGIWGDILWKLNDVVRAIQSTESVKAPVQSRLADFTVFCARIAKSGVLDEGLLLSGLRALVDRQRSQMLQASSVVEVLEDFVSSQPEDANKWLSYSGLLEELNKIAFKRKINLDMVRTAAGLKRHLEPRLPALAKLYGTELRQVRDRKGRVQEQIRFPESSKLDFKVQSKDRKQSPI